jgi:DNA-binding GntR family transcriptional regulator
MNSKDIKLNLYRETLVDRILNILEDRILTGELQPKAKLSEPAVASEFGISRAPAREALQRLEDMNLVRKTHLGREVAEFSPKEFQDVYELKNVVEAFGAMKGALNAREVDLEKIQSILNDMADCTNSGEIEKLRYLNYQFHDTLVSCSGNQKLSETFLLLAKQVRWATSLSLKLPDRPKKSLVEHRAIFQAFKNKEAEKVRILVETHSDNNMQRVLGRMKSKKVKR